MIPIFYRAPKDDLLCVAHHINNRFVPIQDPFDPEIWADTPPSFESDIDVILWNILEEQSFPVRDHIIKQLLPWFLYTALDREEALNKIMRVHELTADNSTNAALFGQKGVFAQHVIPPFTVLGPYAGRFIQTPALASRELRVYPDEQIGRYLFSCAVDGGFPYISGFGSGNVVTLINDCRPDFDILSKDSNSFWFKSQNCCSITIRAKDIFGIFYVSTKNILKNNQILVDYGDRFWII